MMFNLLLNNERHLLLLMFCFDLFVYFFGNTGFNVAKPNFLKAGEITNVRNPPPYSVLVSARLLESLDVIIKNLVDDDITPTSTSKAVLTLKILPHRLQ